VETPEPRAAERRVELILRVAPEVPDDLHGDPVRLREVFLNLIGNAVRFTRDGTVAVILEPLGTGDRTALVCQVRDTGTGIRPEVQARLFQARRSSASTSTSTTTTTRATTTSATTPARPPRRTARSSW
jgi:signal transduction histidine kinase